MENYKNSMRNLILTAKSGGNLPNTTSEVVGSLNRVRSGRKNSHSNSP